MTFRPNSAMAFQKRLNRTTRLFLLGFMVVAISLTYWSVFASPSMLARNDNPRLVEIEESIKRGTIYDRSGQILAQSVPTQQLPSGWWLQKRTYPHLEAISAVGYYNLTHGAGGVEEAFDKVLRGDDIRDNRDIIIDSLLHRPEVGSDVKLTLDLSLQKRVSDALAGHRGAVIAVDVPSGAVLALVSAPSFDPTNLDQTYDTLLKDKNAPLLNRVIQGIYQPGGALETVILAAMLTDQVQLDTASSIAMQPVQIGSLSLKCAGSGTANTLIQAYALGCPAFFANEAMQKPLGVQTMINAFELAQPPMLVSFQTLAGAPSTPLSDKTDPAFRSKQGAGQADLTVTPLQMVLVAATIANHGNAITPYLADAIRRPDGSDWQPLTKPDSFPAVITRDVSDSVRSAMRQAVTDGAAQAANVPDHTIYGHASIAYTGHTADSWFIGFIDVADNHSIAVAAVIEDTNDPSTAAQIGGLTLAAAGDGVKTGQ